MIPAIITLAILVAIVLLSLATKDHAMLVLHPILSASASLLMLVWAEANYGILIEGDVLSAIMWGSTLSLIILLVRTVKGTSSAEM